MVKMVSTKVKKTWINQGEFESIKVLCDGCKDKQFVEFIKEHCDLSFPKYYFQKFCWIKFRFDDLLFQWNNSSNKKETLLEYMKIQKTYPEYYNEEEDCLDFGDFNIRTGRYINEQPTTSLPESDFTDRLEKNNAKVRFSNLGNGSQHITSPLMEVYDNNKKDPSLVVNSYLEVPFAMKCILWSLNNEPCTTAKLYSFISYNENGIERKFTTEEYKTFLNPIIEDAVKKKLLMLKKQEKDGKNVFLYSNPTDKRIGYFYDGKLLTTSDIAETIGINENTLRTRLRKYGIRKAILNS